MTLLLRVDGIRTLILRILLPSAFLLAVLPNTASAQTLFPHGSDELLLLGYDGNPKSLAGLGFDNTGVPGAELALGGNAAFPFVETVNRTVTFAAPVALTDAIVRFNEPIVDPDHPPDFSDVLGMKITSVNPAQTQYGVQFSFWSEDTTPGLSTSAQFVNSLNLNNPRTFTINQTGAAQDVTGLLFSGNVAIPASNLFQVIVASDFNNALDPNGGDAVGTGRGFGAPFISDATEFNGGPAGQFSGDDTPPPGGMPADPSKPFYTVGCGAPGFPCGAGKPVPFTPNNPVADKRVIVFEETSEVGIVGDPENGTPFFIPGHPNQLVSDMLVMTSVNTATGAAGCQAGASCEIDFYFWSENPNVTGNAFFTKFGSVFNQCIAGIADFCDEFGHPAIIDLLFPAGARPTNLPFTAIQNKSDPPVPEPATLYLFGGGLVVLMATKRMRRKDASGYADTDYTSG